MELTCAYKQLIVILLGLLKMTETETKEFYCTKEDSWTTAMSTCRQSGGTPMSYREIEDATDVELKQGITVWTSDYIYWNTVESMSQLTEDYECGYMRFSRKWIHSGKFEYTSTTGVEYDSCTNKRLYFCENEEASEYIYKDGPGTWLQAYQSCRSSYKLWSGYFFNGPYIGTPQFWVKSAKTFIRDTLTAVQNLSTHLTKCGTSEGTLEREGRNNCDHRFKAVCILENKTDDTRFSHSCFQEAPTTTPTTTLSTRKTTLKPTRPTTQPKTTVEPSLQSTETFNGTRSQSTPSGLPKTIIIVIAATITAVIICCIMTVFLLFCCCKKRRKRDETHSSNVKFTANKQSTASVVLSTTNNPNDNDGDGNDADATAYYEVSFDSKDANNVEAVYSNDTNNVEAVYSNEKQNYDYGYTYSVSEKPKPSNNSIGRVSVLDSEYDTTNNVKVFNESSNIYNKLGYESPEGIYDSTMSKPNRKPALDTNIYSTTSARENLYDTTSAGGLGSARQNDILKSPDGHVYGYTDRYENDDSRVYGNLVTG